MAINELINNIDNDTPLSVQNLKAIFKNHILDCWISPQEGGVDLKLDIVGDESFHADCDVTDHYVESNTAYQDQITLKPKTYTISGEVGELVWYQKNAVSQTLGQVAQKLEGVISFLPIRSKGFNQMKNTVMKASQWVDTASNALTKLSSLVGVSGYDEDGNPAAIGAMTRQQQAYIWLTWLRDTRKLVDIKTPWGVMESYVITNLEFRQPKETKDKSYITITFKEFRTTSIRVVPFDAEKYQGNAALENQPKAPQGKTDGEDVSLPKETTTTTTGAVEEECPVSDGDGNTYTVDYVKETGEYTIVDLNNKQTLYSPGSSEYDRITRLAWGQCNKKLTQQGATVAK